jgi:hypothetical protein
VKNEEPNHDDGSPARGLLRSPLIAIFGYKNGDDDMAVAYISQN